ncbi:Protein N-acetyltransferase, RimJ/RimL family [Dyella sp. OK004]|uniref:GNAT family N-acetyltransferase n=1 Tax=Dyella sp. OK004 TaxID=1855292 RepID=UPI0008F27328|nr:GNAT family N-acetyltransferase [Dyella sp. OK004]SFS16897.1 Protein N-acetyltransferase, RimJ/RimL family [Dyella sp. OK004]
MPVQKFTCEDLSCSISTIATKQLFLREPVLEDVDAVWSIFGDPRTSQFSPSGPLPDRYAARDRLATWLLHWHERRFGYWAVTEKGAPEEIVGFGGLLWRSLPGYPDSLHLGYRLAHRAWGKGLATELGRAALTLANQLGFSDVLAVVAPDNGASIRVIEKLGMHPIGDVDDVIGHPPSLVFRAGV